MSQATIQSLKDLGYQQAKTGDSLTAMAQYAVDTITGFPDTVSPEARAELYEGYRLRFNDNNPPKTYAVIDGNYIEATPEQVSNKKVEKVVIGTVFAFSFSSQEFGKLANTEPAKHALIKVWRDNAADYCSNRLGDLKREANKLLNKGKTKNRQTLDFTESVKKVFDQLQKSVKVKSAKGDISADATKFQKAVDAFWKTYKV